VRWVPYGDSAWLVEVGPVPSPEAARRIRALDAALGATAVPGLGERLPGYRTLTVLYDPLRLHPPAAEAVLAAAAARAEAGGDPAPTRRLEIPVVYGGEAGPDLESLAAERGLPPQQVVARHAGRAYRVYFLGFVPGFAYMGDCDPAIAAPRLSTPRRRVPAGSVGLADRQTGVYPRPTPGGWRLLGRTPLRVFDPRRPEPSLFRPGDEVAFLPVSSADFGAVEAAEGLDEPGDEGAEPALRVVHPGLLTTIQDLGRWGHQAEGVPPAGAADPPAARLANLLVGNADGAAVLEVTALGPRLVALRDLALGLAGADLGARVDGRDQPPGTSFLLPRGSELTFTGPRRGCRAYLAVAGGIAAAPVLGSRSADPLGGLGPRALRAGDVLAAHPAAAPPAELAGRRLPPDLYPLPDPAAPLEVGILRGPQADWFQEGWEAGERPVAVASDRVGLRLEGPPVRRLPDWRGAELPSEGNVLGAVQVPPDGSPVVLLAGRPTVGGYPKPAVVCTVDAWRLAQALPGATRVRLRPVDLASAQARLAHVLAAVVQARSLWG
jgi:KipI family sensor histidine kinase inhibitor